MLTLPNTIALIRALDTAPDIISQACEAVLGKQKPKSSSELCAAVLDVFAGTTPKKAIAVLVDVLTATAAATVKTGSEIAFLKMLYEDLSLRYSEALQRKYANLMKEDSKAAIAGIISLLEQEK